MLGDWIKVRKLRYRKQYEVLADRRVRPANSLSVKNGCDLEFTTVNLPQYKEEIFTIGLEAFGEAEDLKDHLLTVLNELDRERTVLKSLPSQVYAEWLKSIDTSTFNS